MVFRVCILYLCLEEKKILNPDWHCWNLQNGLWKKDTFAIWSLKGKWKIKNRIFISKISCFRGKLIAWRWKLRFISKSWGLSSDFNDCLILRNFNLECWKFNLLLLGLVLGGWGKGNGGWFVYNKIIYTPCHHYFWRLEPPNSFTNFIAYYYLPNMQLLPPKSPINHNVLLIILIQDLQQNPYNLI